MFDGRPTIWKNTLTHPDEGIRTNFAGSVEVTTCGLSERLRMRVPKPKRYAPEEKDDDDA
jgi:hypothetical protein